MYLQAHIVVHIMSIGSSPPVHCQMKAVSASNSRLGWEGTGLKTAFWFEGAILNADAKIANCPLLAAHAWSSYV